MPRVFIDSSVLVAACGSKSGASALILGYCRNKRIQGVITLYAVNEAKKNVFEKMGPTAQSRLDGYLRKANLLLTSPPPKQVADKFADIAVKDAPILAATVSSRCDILVTLDRKHLLIPQAQSAIYPVQIQTPGEVVRKLESVLNSNQ